MAKRKETTINSQPLDDTAFATMQVKEAIETFRSQFGLLIQILTALVIADVTIIGYAVSNKIAGMGVVGAFMPLAMMLVISGAGRLMLPVIFTAISIEKKFANQNGSWLMSTLYSTFASADFTQRLEAISKIENPEERMKSLLSLRLNKTDRILYRLILILLALLQLAAAFLLNSVYGWRFF
jgi:hypothetical protein